MRLNVRSVLTYTRDVYVWRMRRSHVINNIRENTESNKLFPPSQNGTVTILFFFNRIPAQQSRTIVESRKFNNNNNNNQSFINLSPTSVHAHTHTHNNRRNDSKNITDWNIFLTTGTTGYINSPLSSRTRYIPGTLPLYYTLCRTHIACKICVLSTTGGIFKNKLVKT